MKGVLEIVKAIALWALVILLTFGFSVLLLPLWAFFVFAGSDGRAAKAASSLKTTLMPDEQLVEQAIQHRVFALFSRRVVVAITNSRIVTLKRGLLGGFKMLDIQWKDLKDATIEQNVLEGICGSNLTFAHLNPGARRLAVSGIQSDVASKIYSRAQAEEQAWEEKRRIRGIEEVRAAAGGVYIDTPYAREPKTAPPGNRMLEEIQKAKELLDTGVVSDAEFQEMKAKILAGA